MDRDVPRTTGAPAPTAVASVSVIVPVWNVEPWLRECLDSVVGQTIGLDRLELIAVDDGSTDGSGRILDEYATRYPAVTVVHEPNSGGPGRPRNVGLDRASGRYVFFLDADDYLGVEALDRLVAMAERNASDIVLGKMVGVDGRKVYRATGVFARNVDRAAMEQVYQSSSVLKLFRRSFLDRVGLRFGEGVAGGEDGDWMARIYLEAATISVVADYDCYFARRRAGSQTMRKDRSDDLVEYITRLERERIRAVAARRKPGPRRDILLRKHIRKLSRKFGRSWRALEPDERRRVFDAGAAVVRRWHNERIQRAMPAREAIRAYCLQQGLLAELEDIAACPPDVAFRDPLVERGRIYARYPHFRDGSGIPDSCFDITSDVVADQRLKRAAVAAGVLQLTGEAYLRLVGGATTVELRRWPRGATWRFAAPALPTPESPRFGDLLSAGRLRRRDRPVHRGRRPAAASGHVEHPPGRGNGRRSSEGASSGAASTAPGLGGGAGRRRDRSGRAVREPGARDSTAGGSTPPSGRVARAGRCDLHPAGEAPRAGVEVVARGPARQIGGRLARPPRRLPWLRS